MKFNKLSNEQYEIRIKKWKKINHLYAVGIVVILAIISKDILEKYTNAVFPFLDALTTFGAIITTYMVAKKIFLNYSLTEGLNKKKYNKIIENVLKNSKIATHAKKPIHQN